LQAHCQSHSNHYFFHGFDKELANPTKERILEFFSFPPKKEDFLQHDNYLDKPQLIQKIKHL
jgi:hypothetical protein